MNLSSLFDFKPKMTDFAAEMLKTLARSGLSGWSFDPTRRYLTHPSFGVINLSNLHHEYVIARRADRPFLLSKYVELANAATVKVPHCWAEAAEGIRAVVRSRFDYTAVDIDHREDDSRPEGVSWPFLGDMCVRLVYDFGIHVSHVTQETMISWGQSRDAVRRRALENMGRLKKPIWQTLGAGVYQLIADEYAESFLLVDDAFDELPFRDVLVAVPCNRGVLLATDGESAGSLLAMIDEAQRCLQSKPWPMSGTLCVRAQGSWQEFNAPTGIDAGAHRLQILNDAITYNDQKEALDRYHQKIGRDVFVATYAVIDRDGTWSSWCTWAEGVPTLLARTDLIAFSPELGAEGLGLVRWDDVVAHVGVRLQLTEEDPQRYFVDSFPGSCEWQALKAVNVT